MSYWCRALQRAPLLSLLFTGLACSSSSTPADNSVRSMGPRDAGHDAHVEDAGHDASAPLGTHVTGQSIVVDGATRTYDITTPETCDAAHVHPLVFVLHGDDEQGADMYGASFPIEEEAAAAGDEAIFVYPNGTNANENGSAWDIYDDPGVYPYTKADPTGNPDVDFFDAMVHKLESSTCVDASRLFITGFSNGGYMTNQLARWRSMVVRAAAVQSGGPPAGSATASNDYAPPNYCVGKTQPVPALIIHGAADTTVPPSNAEQSASYWDMTNGCADGAADCSATTNSLVVPPATPSTPTTPSPCVTFTGCNAADPVVLCIIPGMEHAIWSDAPETIWAFFAAVD